MNLALKPPPVAIALLGLGVVWYYTQQRKAYAAAGVANPGLVNTMLNRVPSGKTGTVLAPSGKSGATKASAPYTTAVNNALRLPTAASAQAGASQTPLALLTNLFSSAASLVGGSGSKVQWSSPENTSMSVAEQYAAYGQGRAVTAAMEAPVSWGPYAGFASTDGYQTGSDTNLTGQYKPDNAGEAQAQAYYLSNPDEFISNPPATIVYADGQVGNTGGWLDSQ